MSALERCLQDSHDQGNRVIVVVDANNVRGKTDVKFEWTQADLLRLLREWRTTTTTAATTTTSSSSLEIICVVDHGCRAQAFSYPDLGLVVLAGPHQTADDVIAVATRWLTTSSGNGDDTEENANNVGGSGGERPHTTHDPHVFVITSDRELRQRCLRNNRPGNFKRKERQQDLVKVFDSRSLVRCLQQQQQLDSSSTDDNLDNSTWKGRAEVMERRSRTFETSVARPPLQLTRQRQRQRQHQSTEGWEEKTWHRVLFAEHLRRLLMERYTNDIYNSSSSDHLLGYQRRFQQAATEKDDKGDNKTHASTMFRDHRIRYDPYQQQELLHYLDQSVDSDATKRSEFYTNDTEHSTILPVPSPRPTDSCAEFLRQLIHESDPGLSPEELVSSYIQEAPTRFQFSQRSDVVQLVRLVTTTASLDDEEDDMVKADRKGTPSRQRTHRGYSRRNSIDDQALVEMGRVVESRWWKHHDVLQPK